MSAEDSDTPGSPAAPEPTTVELIMFAANTLGRLPALTACERAAVVARELQPAVGLLLRASVGDARRENVPWMKLGAATGIDYPVLCRQFQSGKPMLGPLSRPSHQKRRPDHV